MMRRTLPKLPPFKNPPAPPAQYWVTADITAFRHFIMAESRMCYRSSQDDPKGLTLFLLPDADDAALGEAAWAVLRAARFVHPTDPDWRLMLTTREEDAQRVAAKNQSLLDRAGLKTLRALYSGAKLVSFRRKDGQIRVEAWAREGYDGWTAIPGDRGDIYPDTIGEAEFGRAVRMALERAQG